MGIDPVRSPLAHGPSHTRLLYLLDNDQDAVCNCSVPHSFQSASWEPCLHIGRDTGQGHRRLFLLYSAHTLLSELLTPCEVLSKHSKWVSLRLAVQVNISPGSCVCAWSLHPSSKLLESRLCVILLLWCSQYLEESLTGSYCSVIIHSVELNFISTFSSATNIWWKMTAESGNICIRKD